MWRGLVMGLCLVASACGIEPGRPMLTGANEMQTRPGVFTGATGDLLLIGVDPVAQERAD